MNSYFVRLRIRIIVLILLFIYFLSFVFKFIPQFLEMLASYLEESPCNIHVHGQHFV